MSHLEAGDVGLDRGRRNARRIILSSNLGQHLMSRISMAALAVALLIMCGCGDNKLAPVSGRVLVDGEPVENLVVLFQPIGGRDNENPGKGSSARTDKDGRYTLEQDAGVPGAVVGKHKVAIFTPMSDKELKTNPDTGSEDGAPPQSKEIIPPKYNDLTELTFDVPAAGCTEANFTLETGRKKKPKK
jgi:hypothetical protein